MIRLHDDHKYSEPILVLTGLSYLFPAFFALQKEEYYLSCSLVFLCSTTVLFHGTRWEYFFYIDVVAILNYIAYALYLSPEMTARQLHATWFPVVFGFYTYFVGMRYQIFSFDPDWNTQMFWHGLMHLFSAYSACVYLQSNLNRVLII